MFRSLKRLVIQGLVASSVLVLSACATLEPVRVARVEMYQIATVTLTDEQYLTGAKGGKPATIAGELRIPILGKDKLPAVVLLHGGLGVIPPDAAR